MITAIALSCLFSTLEIVMLLGIVYMWQEIEQKCVANPALAGKIADAWLLFRIILVAILFIFAITYANYIIFFN